MSSPTERSMNLLRKNGWLVSRAEHWNHFARKRFDLFGFIDIVAIKGMQVAGIQSTTASNMSARRKKIALSGPASMWKQTGALIVLHGWRKKDGRWICKEETL